jgi:hypothetical protein
MKSVLHISCDECQEQLLAFIHKTEAPLMRRRVSRHLDYCAACYALYLDELDLMRNLSRNIPLIGQQNRPDFAQVWNAVQADLQKPKLAVPQFQCRYGVAMFALVLVLLVPLMLGNHHLRLDELPTPPAPITHNTPNGTISKVTETTIAFLTDFQQSTPEPRQHTAGPLQPDAVITPSF